MRFSPCMLVSVMTARGPPDFVLVLMAGIGMYHCAGKQLALWEMRSVIARVALQFDISLAPGEDGREFDEGVLDTFTMALPPLQMCFKERNRGN